MKRTLGVCYYPEHWPEEIWAKDAARMAALGLSWVRIGEFAWSRIEPVPGSFDWGWLDRAVEILRAAGLKVVLGTPTATPPIWMVEKHPDMLALDAEGRVRGFGSRRHYCFSHEGYLGECRRIVRLLAERYGSKVAAWQTDNEYGCHDTTLSFSDAARGAFQAWCQARYGQIDALNTAWGNVFWSMEYARFDQIGLPNLTVTEANPAHVLAFRRFASDQVARFNRAQAEIIREHSEAPIAHNYMGRVTDFDHFEVGGDLEIASWDSYPLGFLEDRVGAETGAQRAFTRQGDPDFQAFHHDLYRSVGKGRWWVMEQQPGPVNWAPYNPAPLAGMVKLWTWEAFAHGAEAVCYFRWRQAPFAQEQLHAGLLRPDGEEAPGFDEAAEVAAGLAGSAAGTRQGSVAILFDYAAEWAWQAQPHGAGLSYFGLVFDHYRALRRMGLNVDILPASARDFSGYALVCAPGLMHMPDGLKTALIAAEGQVVLGPRSGARDADFTLPEGLPPALAGSDLKIARLESLRPDAPIALEGGGALIGYAEELEGQGQAILTRTDGLPAAMRLENGLVYMAGWGDAEALDRLLRPICVAAGLDVMDLPEGLRVRETETERFWFNYNAADAAYLGRKLPAAGVLREAL